MLAQNQHLLFLCLLFLHLLFLLSPDALAPGHLPLGTVCALLHQMETQAWTSKGHESPQKLLVGCKSQRPSIKKLNTRHEKPSFELLVNIVQETPKTA